MVPSAGGGGLCAINGFRGRCGWVARCRAFIGGRFVARRFRGGARGLFGLDDAFHRLLTGCILDGYFLVDYGGVVLRNSLDCGLLHLFRRLCEGGSWANARYECKRQGYR